MVDIEINKKNIIVFYLKYFYKFEYYMQQFMFFVVYLIIIT